MQMCRPCRSLHIHALKEERRQIKERRAARAGLEEGTTEDMAEQKAEPKHMSVADAVNDVLIDAAIERAVDGAIDNGADSEEALAAGLAAGYEQQRMNGRARHVVQPADRKKPGEDKPVRPGTAAAYRTFEKQAQLVADDRKLAIGALYEDTSITVESIGKRFGVSYGVMMTIVRELGIVPRSQRPDFKRGPKQRPAPAVEPIVPEVPAPEPVARLPRSITPAPPVPAQPVLIPDDAPLRISPLWLIKVEGELELEGEKIEDVIAQARRTYPRLRIRGIDLIG